MASIHGLPLMPVVSDMSQNPRIVMDVIVGPNGQAQVQVAHYNCENGWPQAATIIQTGLGAAMNLAFEALTEREPLIQTAHNLPPTRM